MIKKFKVFKKLFLIFLVLICTKAINVNAITITTNSSVTSGTGYQLVTNLGDFTIYNEGNSYDNTQFKAYKLVDVFYNKSTDSLKYQFTSDFQNYLTNFSPIRGISIETFMSMNKGGASFSSNYYNVLSDNVITGGHLTSNEFAELMSYYANYIREYSASGFSISSSGSLSASPYYPYKTDRLPVGTYLILPRSADYVYAVMVDSVQLKKKNNEWVIDPGNIAAKKSEATIINTFTQGSESAKDISVRCGQNIQGKVSIALPIYPANSTSKKEVYITINDITSTLSSDYKITGMTIVNSTITNSDIKYGTTVVGTISKSGNTLTIRFPDISKINNTLDITYKAMTLNASTAVIGGSGQSRQVSMLLKDPYYSSSPADATLTSTSTLYTYAAQITGTTGAVFSIKKNNTLIGSITIGSNGIGELKGLQTGTYTVEQTQAPSGYTILNGTNTLKVGVGGTQVSGKNGYYNITLKNTVPAVLPYTGSLGTIIFTVIGTIFIVVSIIFLIIYRKRKIITN